jgi:micrococcal nuclease
VLVASVALLIWGGGGEEGAERPGEELPRRAPAEVLRVVDGDTIEVSVGGREEDVRYIGVDTPESVTPGEPVECFGPRASAFNERLVAGRTVTLRFDAERRDRYGRLLAYVYAGPRFVNAELVRRGFARTLTIAPNDSQAGLFARLETAAGRDARGLWGKC